jgi:alpha-mannosidase
MNGARLFALAALLAASTPTLPAQDVLRSRVSMPSRWLHGYTQAVSGDWIMYPWAYPGQTKTLLSRTTDGRMAVEWEAERVPQGAADEPVTYLWHAGTASGYGAHRFAFAVNGRTVATFTSGRTADDSEWSVRGEGGATLSFKTTRVGTFHELFGFMWVTAPRALFGRGAPVFCVTGEAADSQDYYLGPQERVEAWTRVRPEEAVLTGRRRAVRVEVSHLGDAQPVTLRSGSAMLWTGTIGPGHTSVLVPASANAHVTVPLTLTVGDRVAFDEHVALTPVRTRTIHLLPHSHVDIGYSDPQPEVERKQWKNLRDAVALARATSANPPAARFKWNVEGLWSVESYLKQAPPDERSAFVDAVRAGSIGLQANYTNILTGLATPVELRRWTDAARRLQASDGVGPIISVMHSDIPGLSWTTVAALAQAGVRYFSSGPNYMPGLPDGGDRIGLTLKTLGDKPFWWTSPSGEERLLFWMAGRGYSWFHGLNTGGVSDRSRDTILDYVKTLADEGYRYDMIQVRYTTGGDNGPVDPNLPAFVKTWNEQFDTPQLVINTADAMFAEFEQRHGSDLPAMSGDMTPYWEDGALSTAAEEVLVRAASRRLQQAEAIAALRSVGLPDPARAEAWRNILLWREHTWGAADSIASPDRPDVVAQWMYKRRFATEADRQSRALFEAALPPATGIGIVDVLNTLSWTRSGLVLLSSKLSAGGDRVQRGETVVPSQRLRDGRLAVWLEDAPAFSAVRLRITSGSPATPARRVVVVGNSLDNGRIRVEIDRDRSAITHLSWAGAPAHDFAAGPSGLFRYFYVPGRDPALAVSSADARLAIEDAGPLLATVRLDSAAPGTNGLTHRFSLVAGADTIEAAIEVSKAMVRTKESAHIAFPFYVPDGVIRVDQGEALVEIERNQLPGSCRDFIGAQSAVDVSNATRGVSLVTLDAPLIELGALTDERRNGGGSRRWREHAAPGSEFYAYLLNNYWHTNYKADQQGPVTFRFAARPHGAFDPAALRRLSAGFDQPFVAYAADSSVPPVGSPVVLSDTQAVVSELSASDDGRELMFRLFNPTAAPAVVAITATDPATRVVQEDATRRTADAIGGRITLPPFATRTLRVIKPIRSE